MTTPDPAPAPVPSRRVQRLEDLEELLSPKVGLERVETYAMWVFGGTTAFTALGALYTREVVGGLNVWGRLAAAGGLVLLALAMGAATRALAPVMVSYTPGSIDSMERALDLQFTRRRPFLQRAGILLAAALAVYGLAPLAGAAEGAFRRPRPGPVNQTAFTYALSPQSALTATLDVAGVAPFSTVTVTLDPRGGSDTVPVAQAAAFTDSAGRGKAQIASVTLAPGTYLLHARYTPVPAGDAADGEPPAAQTAEQREIRIPRTPASSTAPRDTAARR